MSNLIGFALIGAGVYVAVQVLKREMTRVADVMRQSEAQPIRVEIRMERDPRTGIYRDYR